ncbi:MAG: UPF0489 family protein [Planctomycetaceae bacterium]|nr:UPF0489 family protein [Planctomycetaceae bacterium]
MKTTAVIPLLIVEEHHEVLPIWLRFFKRETIFSSRVLWHIDAHADLKPGCFATDLRRLIDVDEEMLQKFVHTELHFDDFILPAFYLGFFDRLYWIYPKQLYGNHHFSTQKYVRSWEQNGQQLIFGNGISSIADARNFHFEGGCFPIEMCEDAVTILDIEYDFFYCVQSPCIAKKIEITEQEFLRYENDPYHFARLHFCTTTVREEERYFLVFSPWKKTIPGPLEIEESTMIQSVHYFCDWIQDCAVRPQLITLCRATHSGYCPKQQSEKIESVILQRFQNIYPNIKLPEKKT